MKLILLATLGLFTLNSALACSPAQYPFIYQQAELDYIMSSPKLSQALVEIGGQRIETINMRDSTFTFTLATGCFVAAKVIYKAPVDNGMCPRMTDVDVKTGCL